jgi:hypothetical protein
MTDFVTVAAHDRRLPRGPRCSSDQPLRAFAAPAPSDSAGIVAPSLCEHGEPRTGAAEAGQQRRVKGERPTREVIEQSAGDDRQPPQIQEHMGRIASASAAGSSPREMFDVRIEWPPRLFISDAGG